MTLGVAGGATNSLSAAPSAPLVRGPRNERSLALADERDRVVARTEVMPVTLTG